MLRVGQHGRVERLAQPRPLVGRQQLGLDGGQREQGLAQREGEARADLEDGEMGLDQRAQRRLGLVVGGMRLEDEAGGLLDRRRQRPGALGHEVDDLGAAELHAGLHHHGQDPRPGLGQSGLGESGTVDLDRPGEILGPRHLQADRSPRGRRRGPAPRCR